MVAVVYRSQQVTAYGKRAVEIHWLSHNKGGRFVASTADRLISGAGRDRMSDQLADEYHESRQNILFWVNFDFAVVKDHRVPRPKDFSYFISVTPPMGNTRVVPGSVLVTTDDSVEIRWLSHFEEVEGS